jgi:hypothetical protein
MKAGVEEVDGMNIWTHFGLVTKTPNL